MLRARRSSGRTVYWSYNNRGPSRPSHLYHDSIIRVPRGFYERHFKTTITIGTICSASIQTRVDLCKRHNAARYTVASAVVHSYVPCAQDVAVLPLIPSDGRSSGTSILCLVHILMFSLLVSSQTINEAVCLCTWKCCSSSPVPCTARVCKAAKKLCIVYCVRAT